jgi:hypothetical protein
MTNPPVTGRAGFNQALAKIRLRDETSQCVVVASGFLQSGIGAPLHQVGADVVRSDCAAHSFGEFEDPNDHAPAMQEPGNRQARNATTNNQDHFRQTPGSVVRGSLIDPTLEGVDQPMPQSAAKCGP